MYRRYLYLLCFIILSKWSFAQPCVTVYPYHETFETSAGGWTAGGTASDWALGIPTKTVINAAGEGTKCWITGGLTTAFYNNGENSFLVSPCYDFTTLVNPRISFKIFWETEKKFDGATLQYTIDGGTTWILIGSTNSNSNCQGINWYNTPNVTYLGGSQGWAGNIQNVSGSCASGNGGGSGAWLTASHDLTNLAGKPSVKFRFLFGAGTQCNSYDGFAIDDVKLFEAPPNTATFNYSCKPSLTVNFSSQAVCSTGLTWNFGDAASGANNISTQTNPTHIFSAPGTYTVTLVSTFATGPSSTTTASITVLNVNASITQELSCSGDQNAILTATASGSSAAYSYVWNTNPVQSTATITTGAGAYFVTVTSGTACPVTSSTLTVNDPRPLISAPVISNQKCAAVNGSIISNIDGGTPGYSYLWNTGASTSDLTGLTAGTYSLKVTDSKGCILNTGNIVVAHDNGNIQFSLGPDTFICPGTTLTLSPGNFASYLWQDNSTNPTFDVKQTGNYTVNVTDVNGCTGSDMIHVTVDCSDIYFPTAFTPNGDTKNETFGPAGNNLSQVKAYELNIYNRYGQPIFHSTDPYKKWNGLYQNKGGANETFVWTATYTVQGKPQVKKGTVIRIR